MKVKLREVIAVPTNDFECFEDNSILFHVGRSLCVCRVGETSDTDFISLSGQCDRLLAYCASPSQRAVLTAERHRDSIQIASYTLASERRSMSLGFGPCFHEGVTRVQLFMTVIEPTTVYGYAEGRGDVVCVFAVDVSRMKPIALGYIAAFDHATGYVYGAETVSVCGSSGGVPYVKRLVAAYGQWECEERIYRKMHQTPVYRHEWVSEKKVVLLGMGGMYVFVENELVQKIAFGEEVRRSMRKMNESIVIGEMDRVLVYGEINNESELVLVSETGLREGRVASVRVNVNTSEVWVQTVQGEVLVCSGKEGGMRRVRQFRSRVRGGSVTISTGKKYCLLGGENRSVTLWNLDKNECMLRHVFQGDKQMYGCAISPDGDSFIASFEQKLRIYKILLNKYKLWMEFGFKRCNQLCYSHSGQLVACSYGRGINGSVVIINILRRTDIATVKLQQEVCHMLWNQLDDELIMATECNMVHSYRVADSSKVYGIRFQAPITYVRLDYATRSLLVSVKKDIHVVVQGQVTQVISPPMPSFSYVFPLHKYYFAVCADGTLHWSPSLTFQECSSLSLFEECAFRLLYRNGYLIAYCGLDSMLLLQCVPPSRERTKRPELEEVVQVEKSEITALLEGVKLLESNFQLLQQGTQVRVEEDQRRLQEALQRQKQQFEREIVFERSKCVEAVSSQQRQEKENQMTFQRLEAQQKKYITQLESMYDRKIQMGKEKYMDLEQSNLEQRLKYERTILDLEKKYHGEVAAVREVYGGKAEEQAAKMEEVKRVNLQLKKRMKMQLMDAEEENEVVLYDLQSEKDTIIEGLKIKMIKLQEALDNSQVLSHNQKQQLIAAQGREGAQERELQYRANKTAQALNRVKLLEEEVKRKSSMLHRKDETIEQQVHLIRDLQKAKEVLGFRTTQIRKDLEPKEALIDKLRSQLLKLDEQFKSKQRSHFQMSQKIEKLETINEVLKKECSEMKLHLKSKEKVHEALCSEMFMIVNTIEPKDWNTHFVKLYQRFVKEDKFKRSASKKRDLTNEEINRHLIHVEQSLIQVSKGNDKVLRGKEDDLVRKMKENSQLVYELNVMRKKENEYLSKMQVKENYILKMERELGDSKKELYEIKKELTETQRHSTRSQTAKTTVTRKKMEVSRDFFSREHSRFGEEDIEFQEMKERKRIGSAHRTLLWREDKKIKGSKILEVVKELEAARAVIKRQDHMIEELNHRLLGQVEDKQ